jgi:CRISPR-associated endoribonuclease Cas6
MPFSIIVNGYPKDDVPVAHVQGPALQGMFLHLIEQVDPAVSARMHHDGHYRPYTLSPLGIGETPPYAPLKGGISTPPRRGFRGFRLPQERMLRTGKPCYLRITLLEDNLFPTFSRYFLSRTEPTFRLGETQFAVTSVLATPENENDWSNYVSYDELIERARMQAGRLHSQADSGLTGNDTPLRPPQGGNSRLHSQELRRIKLYFVTPTSFSKGDMDLPLPLPRLVFQSYLNRFREFHDFEFLSDFVELVDLFTGISSMKGMRTDTIKTKKVILTGFVGEVSFEISKKAPPELVFQMNLLADFAFFCGTGKKTTVGMGQTVRTTGIEYKKG